MNEPTILKFPAPSAPALVPGAKRRRRRGRRARLADDPGGLERGDRPTAADARSAAERGAPTVGRAGGQESRAGPQESPGRPGTDGVARGPRGAQQPGADEAVPEPAPAADRRRPAAAWTCSTKSWRASPRWRRRSATCCTSPASAIRGASAWIVPALLEEVLQSLAAAACRRRAFRYQIDCPHGPGGERRCATCCGGPC